MNGTLRGAVEEFNLCMNLRAKDVLFAECIRTFATVHVDAQQWMHRLEVELERVGEMQEFYFEAMHPLLRAHVHCRKGTNAFGEE